MLAASIVMMVSCAGMALYTRMLAVVAKRARLGRCWRASENAVFWSSAELYSRPSSWDAVPDTLIQLDPFATLTANRAPSEITVTFTFPQDNQRITLIRHARPALAASIGALT